MIYQNELNESIRGIACYFNSIAYYRELSEHYQWRVSELNNTFDCCKLAGFIDANDCIHSPGSVALLLHCKLSFKGKFYTDYKPTEQDYVIGCLKKTRDAEAAHFVVHDGSGIYTKDRVLFDPFYPGSRTVKIGLCTSLRVFTRS